MPSSKILVATIPGMISENDLKPISLLGKVIYLELDKITETDLAARCDGIDVLMLNYDVVKHLGEDFYKSQNVQKLKSVSTDITGMDWASPEIARRHNVQLQNIPHYSTESVAETTLAEVLMHSRERLIPLRDEALGHQVTSPEGINLLGRKAGVVGYGSIGRRVTQLLSAIGMDVRVWNRTQKPDVTTTSLESIFDECEVICLCVATELTGPNSNKGFVNSKLLDRCPGTILINLASEHLVEIGAVEVAIQAGKIRGYSVERSKNSLGSKLASMRNVHLPPSNSWKSPESIRKLRDIWVENTISSLRGTPKNIFKAD